MHQPVLLFKGLSWSLTTAGRVLDPWKGPCQRSSMEFSIGGCTGAMHEKMETESKTQLEAAAFLDLACMGCSTSLR